MDTIYSKLKKYSETDSYPYHMPGHKRKSLTCALDDIADIDITEIYDFDNLADPSGILKDAQDSLAEYLGVQRSYYLVNGSTVGILAAISCAVPKKGKLIIARNAHKSTYHAMCIRDITPAYIYPNIIENYNIFEAVTADQVEDCLKNNPDANAVIVVSPTYEGRIADISAIAKVVHSYNIPLIVDEAHGAHLSYAEGVADYGSSACRLGADIVIQSLHKTIPSPTQTAVLHFNSNIIDISALEKYLHVYQTSSPSYVLMAGIEASIIYMKKHGKNRLEYMREQYKVLINAVNDKCIYIEALPYKSGKQDIGKFIFSAKKAGITGKELTDILREKYHLEFEMNVKEYVLAMFTVADEQDAYDRLLAALLDYDKYLQEHVSNNVCDAEVNKFTNHVYVLDGQEIGISMSEAWEACGNYLPIDLAVGHIVNEFIGLYPPGTPILVPGEVITKQHAKDLKRFIELGYEVTGIYNGMIKIVT